MFRRLILPLLIFAATCFYFGAHEVPTGHIGVYTRFGALQKGYSSPGLSFMMPFVTRVDNVEMRMQTDVVRDVPCGSSGGIMAYFERIEVVNVLAQSHAWSTIERFGPNYDRFIVYDRVAHEIAQFCSRNSLQQIYIDKFDELDESLAEALQAASDEWDTGVQIIAVRVTRPTIPTKIQDNYLAMAEQETRLRVAVEQAKVAEREERTKQMRARIAAEQEKEVAIIESTREKEVAVIRVERHIAEKEGEQRVAEISDLMHLARERAMADAKAYAIEREADAMRQRLTPEFLKYTLFTSVANNTKVYFGQDIPSMFAPWQASTANDLLSN